MISRFDSSLFAVVQARMSSERLPGKSLASIDGRACLFHVLDALRQEFLPTRIVVATSQLVSDDPIAEAAENYGVGVVRGDLNDVASRFLTIATRTDCSYLLRISGDSPLMEHRTVRNLWALIEEGADLATTVSACPFPSGMNMEIVSAAAFREAYARFSTPAHFEHVTPYFYENRSKFRLASLDCAVPKARSYKFTVDTAEDLERIRRLHAAMAKPHWEYTLEEKCRLWDELGLT